jgi:hypothetical protein
MQNGVVPRHFALPHGTGGLGGRQIAPVASAGPVTHTPDAQLPPGRHTSGSLPARAHRVTRRSTSCVSVGWIVTVETTQRSPGPQSSTSSQASSATSAVLHPLLRGSHRASEPRPQHTRSGSGQRASSHRTEPLSGIGAGGAADAVARGALEADGGAPDVPGVTIDDTGAVGPPTVFVDDLRAGTSLPAAHPMASAKATTQDAQRAPVTLPPGRPDAIRAAGAPTRAPRRRCRSTPPAWARDGARSWP